VGRFGHFDFIHGLQGPRTPYLNLVREHAPNAQILFDRFHIVKHLNEAVDAVRRELWRRLASKQRVTVKGTRWLLLKNPWNLNPDQKERLSTLVRWNTPLVRAWYLKEAFQLFWAYKQPGRAGQHLRKWINSAMRSRLEACPASTTFPGALTRDFCYRGGAVAS
jgi:transposase